MNVRTICLALLFQEDATGYEIRKQSTEGRFSHFVVASYGSIYPALNKLESEGLVVSREEIQPGRPAKKVYSITDAGRQAYIDMLSAPPAADVFRSEFLLIAANAALVGPELMAQRIDERLVALQEEITRIEQAGMECAHAPSRWVAEYGLFCFSASISYLEQNRERLIALAKDAENASHGMHDLHDAKTD